MLYFRSLNMMIVKHMCERNMRSLLKDCIEYTKVRDSGLVAEQTPCTRQRGAETEDIENWNRSQ